MIYRLLFLLLLISSIVSGQERCGFEGKKDPGQIKAFEDWLVKESKNQILVDIEKGKNE